MRDTAEHYDILHGLAEAFNPKTYLEIGCREGASVSCVLAKEKSIVQFVKDCLMDGRCFINDDIVKRVSELYTLRQTVLYLFDNWGYMGSKGGHERLHSLLRDGFKLPNWQFQITDGDSKETIPKFLETHSEPFDLVLVDGDHSPQGASADLDALAGRFRVLAMHDLYHPQHSYLEQVFLKYVRSNDYPYFTVGRRPPAMGTGSMLQPLVRLNIGCGNDRRDGYVNCDVRRLRGLTLYVDAKRCEFRESSLDEVYARGFLEHLTRREAQTFAANCRRWLRVGGSVTVTDVPNMEVAGSVIRKLPQYEGLHRVMTLIYGTDGDGAESYIENRHLWGYTPNSLLMLFQDAGFRVEKVEDFMDGLFLQLVGFKVE